MNVERNPVLYREGLVTTVLSRCIIYYRCSIQVCVAKPKVGLMRVMHPHHSTIPNNNQVRSAAPQRALPEGSIRHIAPTPT